jgi:transcriptional regulator with XRE-family HTH domain
MTGCRSEYDFTLILAGISDFDEDTVDKLFDAGCDDATVAQRHGRVYITFSREAESLVEAIISAVFDVKKANIGASVLRIDNCNLVTQAEIARRLGRSRQNIEQYISGKRGPGGFPPPACNITDGAPLYYWCEVAYWAFKHELLSDQSNHEAQAIATLNTILELEHQKAIAPEITEDLLKQFRLCPFELHDESAHTAK